MAQARKTTGKKKPATTKSPAKSKAGSSAAKAVSKAKPATKKPAAKKPATKTTTAKKAAPAKAAPKKAAAPKSAPRKAAAKAAPRKTKAPARSATSKDVNSKRSMTEAQLRRMSDAQYMNDKQLQYFRERLLDMRREVVDREVDVKQRLHHREVFADPADRATAEEEHWLDLRLRERESLLLKKIDESLRRIEDKEYGYCEVTGEPIGIPRLLARPTATVCVDVKGENEHIEAQYRDR